jgi:hypothetical protein
MYIPNWNDGLRTALTKRRDQLQKEPSLWHEAATVADGLPVYCDIGGCLVIRADGRVVEFRSATGDVCEIEDLSWLRLAAASAADRYPELAEIRPKRPSKAVDCDVCMGVGLLRATSLRCKACMGLGWTDS